MKSLKNVCAGFRSTVNIFVYMYGHSEYLIASHEVESQFTAWPCTSQRRWFVSIWSPLGIDAGLYFRRPYQVTCQPNLPVLEYDFRVTFITVNCISYGELYFFLERCVFFKSNIEVCLCELISNLKFLHINRYQAYFIRKVSNPN